MISYNMNTIAPWLFFIKSFTHHSTLDRVPLSIRLDPNYIKYMHLNNSNLTTYHIKTDYNPRFFLYLFSIEPSDPVSFLRFIDDAYTHRLPSEYTLEEAVFFLKIAENMSHPHHNMFTDLDKEVLLHSVTIPMIQQCLIPWLHDVFTPEHDEIRWNILHQHKFLTHEITHNLWTLEGIPREMVSSPSFEAWQQLQQHQYTPSETPLYC